MVPTLDKLIESENLIVVVVKSGRANINNY